MSRRWEALSYCLGAPPGTCCTVPARRSRPTAVTSTIDRSRRLPRAFHCPGPAGGSAYWLGSLLGELLAPPVLGIRQPAPHHGPGNPSRGRRRHEGQPAVAAACPTVPATHTHLRTRRRRTRGAHAVCDSIEPDSRIGTRKATNARGAPSARWSHGSTVLQLTTWSPIDCRACAATCRSPLAATYGRASSLRPSTPASPPRTSRW